MPRFVILRHETPPEADRPTHWDLMLEQPEDLATWALAAPPASGLAVAATRLPAHRSRYLDWEGSLSGGRGTVTRWDAGTYQLDEQSDHLWRVTLTGRVLRGVLVLEADPHAPARWVAHFTAH